MEVVVLGAGSLGSLLGGLLARRHDVTLVGRGDHVARVAADGLEFRGAVTDHVSPAAGTTVPDAADLAVVAVKAGDTENAADALADCRLRGALSVQNGMGNEATLAARLDCEVLAGTCTYGAVRREPGVVECTGVGEVVLGPREGGESTFSRAVADAFEAAGVVVSHDADMPRRLWEKLAVNAAINAPTALARVENGALQSGSGHDVAVAAAREAARAAQTEGVDLTEAEAVAAFERVADATAANTSSMHQDVLAGQPTEVEAINGYVVSHAPAAPVNRTLRDLLVAWERANAD
jgi:2-dehydropantoate 2-reductase